MRKAGLAVFVLREIATTGHVGLGVMRGGLGDMGLMLATCGVGGCGLAEGNHKQ